MAALEALPAVTDACFPTQGQHGRRTVSNDKIALLFEVE
jgi:hypothetical protein